MTVVSSFSLYIKFCNPSYRCQPFFGGSWRVATVDMTAVKAIIIYDGGTVRVTRQRLRATRHDGNGAQP